MSNKFDIYSSKVKRVNIPIPEFKFFHKASSEEKVDPKFIGREQITDKLFSWLKEDPTGGSYLVTGFRGMGKSSYVGRVLNKLIRRTTMKEYMTGIGFFLSIFIGFFYIFFCGAIGAICFGAFFTAIILSLYICKIIHFDQIAYKQWQKKFIKLMRQEVSEKDLDKIKRKENKIAWKHVRQTILYDDGRERSYKRICVNVNLGQEILNEREVLSLISHQLYTKYREYVLSPIANLGNWLLCTGVLLLTQIGH